MFFLFVSVQDTCKSKRGSDKLELPVNCGKPDDIPSDVVTSATTVLTPSVVKPEKHSLERKVKIPDEHVESTVKLKSEPLQQGTNHKHTKDCKDSKSVQPSVNTETNNHGNGSVTSSRDANDSANSDDVVIVGSSISLDTEVGKTRKASKDSDKTDTDASKSHSVSSSCSTVPFKSSSLKSAIPQMELNHPKPAIAGQPSVAPLSVLVTKNKPKDVSPLSKPPDTLPLSANYGQGLDKKLLDVKKNTFATEMFTHLMNFCGIEPSSLPHALPEYLPEFQLKSQGDVQTVAPGSGVLPRPSLKSPAVAQNVLSTFQANLLANLHKLSSPPNQQVFPRVDSMTGLSVTSTSQTGYKHGSPEKKASSAPATPESRGAFPAGLLPSDFFGEKAAKLLELGLLGSKPETDHPSKVCHRLSIDNIYDSDTPPPNVDVSQLKDKGLGPIPKDLIPSLTENVASSSNEGVDVVNSNISSTSSSPRSEPEEGGGEGREEDENTVRSESACSDRLITPAVKATDQTLAELKTSNSVVVPRSSNTLIAGILSTNTSKPDGLTLAQSRQAQMISLAASAAETSKPGELVSTVPAPPTPTTVVHHTPASLSCHQMSLNKAKQQVRSGKPATGTPVELLSDASIMNPLMAILSDPTIGQAFRQMFPDLMQEALVQSIEFQNKLASLTSVTENSPAVSVPKTVSASLALPVHPGSPAHSVAGTPLLAASAHSSMAQFVQQPSVPVQDVLSNITRGEFPASNLLTAAAKAQFTQQQNQLKLLLNQHIPIPGLPFINPSSQTPVAEHSGIGSVQSSHSTSVTLTTAALPGRQSHTVPPSDNGVNVDKQRTGKGPSKISELLNRSTTNKADQTVSVPSLSSVPGLVTPVHQTTNSCLPSIGSAIGPLNKSVGFPLGQAGGSNISHLTSLAQSAAGLHEQIKSTNPGQLNPQLLQMYSALGLIHPGGIANPVVGGTKDGPAAVLPPLLESMGNIRNVPNINNVDHKVPFPNFGLPFLLQQQQNIQNMPGLSAVLPQDVHQQMLTMFASQGGSPAVLGLPVNQSGQIGPGQAGIQRPGVPPVMLTSHGVDLQSITRPPSQSSVLSNNHQNSNGGAGMPLNVVSVQQTFGNGGSNLTAMQLQTLQLQQQLIEQVQGMQNLINQFNIQSIAVSGIGTSGKDSSVAKSVLTASKSALVSPLTFTSASSAAPVSQAKPLEQQRTCSENLVSSSDSTVFAHSNMVSQSVTDSSRKKYSRVIAAADTTAECSSTTKTVDVAIETDAVEEEEEDSDDEDVDGTGGDEEKKDNAEKSEVEEDSVLYVNENLEEKSAKTDVSCESDTRYKTGGADEVEMSKAVYDKTSETKEKINSEDNVLEENPGDVAPQMVSAHESKVDEKDHFPISTSNTEMPMKNEVVSNVQVKPTATCLAIATEKGNSRSRKSDLKLFKQKSSLAKSQDLAAELSTPSEGELKLKISRKHILASTVTEIVSKKRRKKSKYGVEKSGVTYEKKELRSSTQAATKASSSLAASSIQESKAPKVEKDATVGETKDSKSSCYEGSDTSSVKSGLKETEPSRKALAAKHNIEAECDSSVDISSADADETGDARAPASETTQDELKGKIAAALSSQKGQWLLAGKKKAGAQIAEEKVAGTDMHTAGKGVKRNREENAGMHCVHIIQAD